MSWFTPFFALKRSPHGPGRSCRFPVPSDTLSQRVTVVETRLDTAKGDRGGEGEGDVDGGGAHNADTKSNAWNLAREDKCISISK